MKFLLLRISVTFLLLTCLAASSGTVKPTKNERYKSMKIRKDFKKLMNDHGNDKVLHLFFGRISRGQAHTSKYINLMAKKVS